MKKENAKITFDELMSTLDEYRGKWKWTNLTDEQKKFLSTARNHNNPVPFRECAELWRKAGWGDISESSLAHAYTKLIKDKPPSSSPKK